MSDATIVDTGWNIFAFSCSEVDTGSIHVVNFTPTSEFMYDISGFVIGRKKYKGKADLVSEQHYYLPPYHGNLDKQGILGTEDFVLVKLETSLSLCFSTMSNGYLSSTRMSLII